MSLQTVANKYVELCNQGKNFDVMNTMYDPNIVSVEPTGKETVGKTPVIEKSKRWASVNTIHGEKVVGPYFCGADKFAVYTTFEVTPKATGKREAKSEISVYTVKNDLITREEFFFGGETW